MAAFIFGTETISTSSFVLSIRMKRIIMMSNFSILLSIYSDWIVISKFRIIF